MGKRPDYAAVVYGNLIRQTYKKDAGHSGRYRGKSSENGSL